jgi:SOS-response transcriptional repressor LexA
MGKEKQKELRKDTAWFDRALAAPAPSRSRTHLRLIRCEREVTGAVPIYDLRIAAGAFSEGQSPEATGYGRVEGSAPRRGLFVAQVVGDSMDKVAPKGAWCLWQHLRDPGVAAAAPGEDLVVRLPDGADAEMGRFTFKRLMEGERGRALRPVSSNPEHREIPLGDGDEIEAVARFVAMVSEEDP